MFMEAQIMKLNFSKDPLRLLLGGILVVLGALSLINISIPYGGTIFTVVGIAVGVLLVLRTKYL